MDDEYLDMTIRELRTEVLVKGPELVAEEMGISENCMRQLCPRISASACPQRTSRYDLAGFAGPSVRAAAITGYFQQGSSPWTGLPELLFDFSCSGSSESFVL